jgi:nicotinamide-nucleotide amidase
VCDDLDSNKRKETSKKGDTMIGEIIAVGEEVLAGDVVNSNAAVISRTLAEAGVFCRFHSVVGDIERDIIHQLELASKRSDFVILCGGLGPTKDDLTKETVAQFLNKSLYTDETIVEKINSWFLGRGIQPTENNFKQALVIEDSRVLGNLNGTAPGAYIASEKVHYFLLPGPPNELIPMLNLSVMPIVKEISKDIILSKTFKLLHIGESHAVTILDDLMEASEDFILAPYAKLSEVHIKATAIGTDMELLESRIHGVAVEMHHRLGDHIYTSEDEDLVDVILWKLLSNQATLSTAESCTGGLLSNWFVEKPGVSQVFLEGSVTYSNQSKENRLKVAHDTLVNFGAVSSEVAKAMVEGIIQTSGSTYGISITGIAGPDGGNEEKPVGLVYIGVGSGSMCEVYEHRFLGNRDKIRNNAAKWALIHLWDFLKKKS